MWARHLLFVSVVVCGVLAFRASLFPLRSPDRSVNFDPGPAQDADFQKVVREVDGAFRQEWDAARTTSGRPLSDDWKRAGLDAPPRADDLTVARRLSLA